MHGIVAQQVKKGICPMRKLEVDLGDLAFAFESSFDELTNYLRVREWLAEYDIEPIRDEA
jgi:hypothetical protein